MLPIGNHPDHSCSSYKVPPLNSDERTPDGRVAPLAADPSILAENQTPHFSIRDYALTLRGKDIGSSWPFHQQYLELCLKNGVKDLLPPFEPPDVVRAGCKTKRKTSEQLITCIDKTTPLKVSRIQEETLDSFNRVSGEFHHESHPLSGLSVVENSGLIHRSSPSKNKSKVNNKGLSITNKNELSTGEDETESTVCVVQSQQLCDQSKLVKVPHSPEKIENIQKLSQKKCRLVVKLGAAPDPQRTSEISSNSIMVSDSMTSKVCPVCKTFSSTSNTTLNAHIDQCLSMGSNSKRALVKPLKHKLKPSKKRLMVDIYATAAHCTLEDLDRRNGTSWVSDLSLVSQSNAACTEVKRPKSCSVGPADDENEGAVYVDSNGTKLCILSKLSSRPLDAVHESRARTLEKKDKEPKKLFFSKKRHLAANLPKHMKLKRQSKRANSKRLPMHQMEVSPERNTPVSQEKEESLPQNSSALDEHGKSISTLRPKIRSLCSTKLIGENSDVLQNPVPEITPKRSDSRKYSAMEISPANLTGPPLDFSSLKTKSMNFLSGTALERSQKGGNNLKLKLPNSSRGYSSSLRSRRVECRKIVQRSCEVQQTENVPCLVKRTKTSGAIIPEDNKLFPGSNSSLTKSSLPSPSADADCDARESHFSSEKLRKYRTSLRKSCKESSPGISGVPQAGNNYQDCMINRSSYHLDITDEDVNTNANMSSGESDCGITVKHLSLDLSELEGECNGTDGKGDKPIEGPADVYSAERSPLENTAADHSNTNMVEDQMVSYDANIHEPSTLEENEKLIGGTEAWVELFAPRSSTNQQVHCGDESSNAVVTPNIEMASQLNFSEKGEPCSKVQCIECQAKDAAVGKGHLEMHQDHSCVTSNRTFTNDDHNRESSGSPISAASPISHPTKGDVKDAEPQASAKPAANEFHKIYDSSVNSRHLELVNTESQVPDSEADAAAHAPVKTWDKYSYHCLLGESNPHEFLLSSKGNVEGLMLIPPTCNFNSKPIEPPPLCGPHPNVSFETTSVGSISPRSALDAAVRFPTCRDLGSSGPSPQSQFQGSSKLVLRLMGKNVMIVNKEENTSLREDPPCSSKNLLNAQYPDVHDHSVGGNRLNSSNNQLQNPQFVERSRIMECDPINLCHVPPALPAGMQMNSLMGTTLQNGTKINGLQTYQMGSCKASDLPLVYNVENVAIHRQNQELTCTTCLPSQPREVIVIDDSPDIRACPRGSSPVTARSFSSAFSGANHIPLVPIGCVPLQGTNHHRREVHYGAKHGIPVSCPGTDVHAIMRGNLSDAISPLLPNQFVVPSRSHHLTPHFYSPSLQQWQ